MQAQETSRSRQYAKLFELLRQANINEAAHANSAAQAQAKAHSDARPAYAEIADLTARAAQSLRPRPVNF